MNIFLNTRKLKAAASSMHQFCPVVRSIYRSPPDDDVVEAATVFIYEHTAREVFGRRFADALRARLRQRYRYASPVEVETRVLRIGRNCDEFRRWEEAWAPPRDTQGEFTAYVHSVIRALLAEAGQPYDDPEVVKDMFPRFEEAARRLQTHLQGIRQQSRYVMR
jgi:hypothetical protein